MTELYVPAPGERARVVAVSREDPLPMHRLGDVATVRKATMSIVAGYLFIYEDGVGSTWCRVEPVEKCTCSHDGPEPCCGEHARPDISWCCPECDGEGTVPDINGHDRSDLEGGGEEPEGRIECALCAGTGETRSSPIPARRFCACGQELWSTEQRAGGLCGDCGNRIVGQRPKTIPLDARIRAAQPETEEHAFERPGYSWP